jgi:hypothetical protein
MNEGSMDRGGNSQQKCLKVTRRDASDQRFNTASIAGPHVSVHERTVKLFANGTSANSGWHAAGIRL